MLKIGDQAPVFRVKDDRGQEVSLGDFKGKTVILYFYPKDDTPGCTKESCDFRDQYQKFLSKDTVILGVSRDSVESHVKFKKKFSLPFPLLCDSTGEVTEAYGVWTEKSFMGKKYMGIERSTFVIDAAGVIKDIIRKVKVEGHVEEMLQKVNAAKSLA